MKIGTCDIDCRVMIVAEIGNNHEGDRARAEEMVHAAADAGADAVKFQTIVADKLVASDNPDRLRQLRRYQLSIDDFYHLAETAARRGVVFLSTPFHLEAVDELSPIVPAFKIASGDNDFVALLQKVARTGKPILLSTGLSDRADVVRSIGIIEKAAGVPKGAAPLVLLHCVTSYPTPREQAGLGAVDDLKSLGYRVGYSDHVLGLDAALVAVTMGARVLEKHFTLNKVQSDFRDHQLSADPRELAQLCSLLRDWERGDGTADFEIADREILVGPFGKTIMQCERANIPAARRSVATARALERGWQIESADLTWLRPQIGFRPGEEDLLIGRRAAHDIARGLPIKQDLVS